MNTFIRWCRFSVMGTMGMVLQLAALALLDRWTTGHYLCATVAAIELTLVHNFVWHLHYTWRDRSGDSTLLAQFVRFHLSNGLVSMLGNLALMPVLVHEADLPLLVANRIAILCCSIVNFCFGDHWAFPVRTQMITDTCIHAGDSVESHSRYFLLTAILRCNLVAGRHAPRSVFRIEGWRRSIHGNKSLHSRRR